MRQPSSRRFARSAILGLVAVFLSACTADSPTSPQPIRTRSTTTAFESAADDAGVERPWKGQCDIDAAFDSPTSVRITGVCQFVHLGRVTVVTEETPTLDGNTFLTFSTYTAANGDQLYTTGPSVLTIEPDGSLTLTGTRQVVGGTGRFAGASGTAAYAETAYPTGPTTAVGSYTLDGRLTY